MAAHRHVARAFTVVILAGSGDLAEAAETGSATIVVKLSNQAGVAGGTLAEAQSQVSRIYADVGVEVLWTDAAAAHADGRFVVNLMIRTKPPRPRMMGHAFGDARDTGGTAFVYRDRVEEVARARDVDPATVLAFAMAHEMGHLLLPAPSHAVAGIMRANWDGQNFRDMAARSLRFTPVQGNAIRVKASARQGVVRPAAPPR
jgi:hypothetical protein